MAMDNYTADPKGFCERGAPQLGNTTNSVTAGGSTGIIANFTDLTTYANDAATIRNDIYQLAERIKRLETAFNQL